MERTDINNNAPFMTIPAAVATEVTEAATMTPEPHITLPTFDPDTFAAPVVAVIAATNQRGRDEG